ncbi:unnamed protein product [Auanema sp. JU1783]|nr:unnamed protein product [Auanema sp. JU1783]
MLPTIRRRFCSTFSHVVNDAIRLIRVTENDRVLNIKWCDGHEAVLPIIWLRDTSPDPKTYTFSPAMTARNLVMDKFDVEQSPTSIKLDKDKNELVLEWPGDIVSRYPSTWLRFRNPSCPSARLNRRLNYLLPETTWSSEDMKKRLKTFNHDDVMYDDKTLHDFLEAVCLDGLAVIRNGPKVNGEGVVEEIADRIGFLQRTHFGEVFEVKAKQDASNKAYASTSGLPFHTDFPSLSHPPQLQMLHMAQQAHEGGNSLFVDGFHVAQMLNLINPDAFNLLTKHSMEYIEEGYDVHDGPDGAPRKFDFYMTARHKVIKLDEEGHVIKIQFGNAMRSWFYDCDPNKIQEIYDAMKLFTNLCYDEKNVLKLHLEDGDTVLWANTRVLHTRDDYVDAPGNQRTLKGCYFNWDIVKSKVRVLRKNLNLPESQPSA